MARIGNFAAKSLIALIKGYQYSIRPWLGSACRFEPSCSEYAIVAIWRFGIIKGCILTFRRILHCHPWHPGGKDEVPLI